jgi:hypothetical protein
MLTETAERIDAICKRLQKALDLPIRLDCCPSEAHRKAEGCECSGLPRLEALIGLLLRDPGRKP